MRASGKDGEALAAGAPRSAGNRPLAPFAADAFASRGRLIAEHGSPTRTPFQRDRDRIIHSDAFRRLKHKTQVFVHHQDDHFRTRLTHTIEVGQIARALARALGLDEDLAEALALVHDFGHTPFGHAGERALNTALEPWGGFDHNAQSLRIVTELERRYARFDGLNLCWETLEGLVKHNGPLLAPDGAPLDPPLPVAFRDYCARHDLWLRTWPSAEAQCAAIADDIAYDNHDIEDGLRAGLFEVDDLARIALPGRIVREVDRLHPGLERTRRTHEIVRRQITLMVEDVIAEGARRLEGLPSADAVRECGAACVTFSDAMRDDERELKRFLFRNMYEHPDVMARVNEGERVVRDLFEAYASGAARMPDDPHWSLDGLDAWHRARRIGDWIACMTDRFALTEHARWFDDTPLLGYAPAAAPGGATILDR